MLRHPFQVIVSLCLIMQYDAISFGDDQVKPIKRIEVIRISTVRTNWCDDLKRVGAVFEQAQKSEAIQKLGVKINISEAVVAPITFTDIAQPVRAAFPIPDPTAALIIYVKLHGACDKQTGKHFMELDPPEANPNPAMLELFAREKLSAFVKTRGAGLAVLITDSCSSAVANLGRHAKLNAPMFPDDLFRDLFIDSRGFVDINSSTGIDGDKRLFEAAWVDIHGAIFTKDFCDLLATAPRPDVTARLLSIDSNKDLRYSWGEFFIALQKNVGQSFQLYKQRDFGKDPDLAVQISQTPQAYEALPRLQ